MSDLAATNCGCSCESGNGCSSLIWLILILSCCGGSGMGFGGGCGDSCGGGNDSCMWIILLLLCCSGGCGGSIC